MLGLSIWDLLGLLAIICMIPTFLKIGRSRKPIWGGLVYGIIISAVVGLIALISGNFTWELIRRILTVAILVGGSFWLLDLSSAPPKKKKKKSPAKAKISN